MYQKSISDFFSKGPSSTIRRPNRVTAPKNPTTPSPNKPSKASSVASKLFDDASLPDDVQARIAANRAAAREKMLTRLCARNNGRLDFSTALDPSWKEALSSLIAQPFWKDLANFVNAEREKHTIYPPPNKIFSAFNHSTFARTKVVIIGQDPYHGPNQAHGMSFSVPPGVYAPPSLQNIFRELQTDIPAFKKPDGGCLSKWADQGVLLLNAVLTVQRANPGSHKGRGWERFTDAVVDVLNREKKNVVFLLWGGFAKAKGRRVDRKRHCVLTSSHPSPLSANRGGWFGTAHFSKTNEYLRKTKQTEINWHL